MLTKNSSLHNIFIKLTLAILLLHECVSKVLSLSPESDSCARTLAKPEEVFLEKRQKFSFVHWYPEDRNCSCTLVTSRQQQHQWLHRSWEVRRIYRSNFHACRQFSFIAACCSSWIICWSQRQSHLLVSIFSSRDYSSVAAELWPCEHRTSDRSIVRTSVSS